MRLMRDAMIEISDLVGMRLRLGGSALAQAQIEEAVDAAQKVIDHGQDLIDWLGKGGFPPGGDR
jgi:hypothetical protein